MSIAGGRGATANRIFVVDVKPNGAAYHDGKIKSMDEILEVNHVTIRGISHHDASAILRNTPTHVHLALGRTKEGASHLKRRSAAARDSAHISERASSPSLEQYASNQSLNRQVPSPLVGDESESQRDSPVAEIITQYSEPPQQTVVSLLKVCFGVLVDTSCCKFIDFRPQTVAQGSISAVYSCQLEILAKAISDCLSCTGEVCFHIAFFETPKISSGYPISPGSITGDVIRCIILRHVIS